MILIAALFLAAPVSAPSDLAVARDAFVGLCGDLSSEAATEAAAARDNWASVLSDPKRQVGQYYAAASAWTDWKGAVFHVYRKVVGGHVIDGIVFNVREKAEIGAGLHCSVYMDDARVVDMNDLKAWGTTGINQLFDPPDFSKPDLMQWRDPGAFPTHDITTVVPATAPRSGIEIWAINAPPPASK